MKRADNIAATDSAINYAVSTVSLVRDYYILFSNRGQDEINTGSCQKCIHHIRKLHLATHPRIHRTERSTSAELSHQSY